MDLTGQPSAASTPAAAPTPVPQGPGRRTWLAAGAIVVLGLFGWFATIPQGLTPEAWRVFVLFGSTVLLLLVGVADVLALAVGALALGVLTGVVAPTDAYSGFGDSTVLLIVVAFLIARAVVSCGLGTRLAYVVIRRLGSSSLGLGYAAVLVDALIAPAFPSNTARSGVMFPVSESLAMANDSRPDDGTADRLGAYLMVTGVAGLSLSSALWLTAMAANPVSANLAAEEGVELSFATWTLAAAVPVLALLALLPWLLHRIIRPTLQGTPDATAEAGRRLAAMGPLRRDERITAGVFVGLILGWSAGANLGLDRTAVAFAGLAVLLFTGVLSARMLATEGTTLQVWLWFGALFALATQLNASGFTAWAGGRLGAQLDGVGALASTVLLVVVYTLLHYLFVSQTAHVLALYGVFLSIGVAAGSNPAVLAMLLALASNFFAALTPQASSANLLYVGSGYVPTRTWYRLGAVVTVINLAVLLTVGFAWLSFLSSVGLLG